MPEVFPDWNVEKQLSAISFQPSVRTKALEQTLKHDGQPLIPLIPVVATRNHMELVSKVTVLHQSSEAAIRW
jgi:hypothetical protein